MQIFGGYFGEGCRFLEDILGEDADFRRIWFDCRDAARHVPTESDGHKGPPLHVVFLCGGMGEMKAALPPSFLNLFYILNFNDLQGRACVSAPNVFRKK